MQLRARTGNPDFLDLPWEHAARGMAERAAGRGRPRNPPPRGALRRLRGPARPADLRAEGAAGRAGAARVQGAPPPRRGGRAGGAGGRGGHRARPRPRSRPDHAPPRLLAPVPDALRARRDARPARAPARRGGGAARPPAPERLLLGRLLALEHALPARRGRARRLPRRRRDGRALPGPLRRPAPARPHDRRGERRRRAHRCRGRARPRGRAGTGGDRDGARRPLRVALGRADARGGLRRRLPVPDRRAAPPPERPRLRRRGGRARRGRRRLSPAVEPPRGRARPSPSAPALAHRPAGTGEPGAAAAERRRALPRRARAPGGHARYPSRSRSTAGWRRSSSRRSRPSRSSSGASARLPRSSTSCSSTAGSCRRRAARTSA